MKRKTWVLAGAVVLVAVAAAGGGLVVSGAKQATPAAQEPPANTAKVEKGKLSAVVSGDGTLTYRARSDGSPFSVINQARGTYTKLPDDGDKVDCGDVLCRVDNQPVLLLCGTVPASRDLHTGDVGEDVRQLNQNVSKLGYAAAAGVDIDPDDNNFTWKTEQALELLRHDKVFGVTGQLDVAVGNMVSTVSATGSVAAPAQAKLNFKSGGRLAQLLVNVGDRVAEGQPLARLDDSDLQVALTQAQASYNGALIGYPAAREYLGYVSMVRGEAQAGPPSSMYVRAATGHEAAVQSLLARTANPEAPNEVNVSQPSDVLTARVAAAGAFDSFFLGLGVVALLVGAVGVANIVIISVLECRSEIGLRRTLGATKGQIRTQFLGESILLAVSGGLGGVLAGAAATAVCASSKSWAVVIPVEAWSGGIASAILIGAFAGLMPAVRASRMPLTVALRTV